MTWNQLPSTTTDRSIWRSPRPAERAAERYELPTKERGSPQVLVEGTDMTTDFLGEIVAAYSEWFGPPISLRRSSHAQLPIEAGVVVRKPSPDEQSDPIANLTLLERLDSMSLTCA